MIHILICTLILVSSVALIYVIISLFNKLEIYNPLINTPLINPPELINNKSDMAIIISFNDCHYCKSMEEKLKGYKKNYITAIYGQDHSLTFDTKIHDLIDSDRQYIINKVQEYTEKAVEDKSLIFPTILAGDKIIKGVPGDIEFNKIFHLL